MLNEESQKGLWAVAVAIVTTLGIKIWEYFLSWKRQIEADSNAQRITNILAVVSALDELVEQSKIGRAMLFVGSNGGMLPRPGHLYKVQCVYGNSEKEKGQVLVDRYEYVVPDRQYMGILTELITLKDCVRLSVDEMPERSMLKDIYLSEGVKYSYMFYLGSTKSELYYCSVASYDENLDDPSTRSKIDLAINLIRSKFKLYDFLDKSTIKT
jgi:hypothetical protein